MTANHVETLRVAIIVSGWKELCSQLQARNDALAARVAEVEAERDAHDKLAREAFDKVVRLAEVERDAARYQRLHKGWRDRFIAEQTKPFCGDGGYLSDLADEQAHHAADQIDAAIDAHAQGQAGEEKDG